MNSPKGRPHWSGAFRNFSAATFESQRLTQDGTTIYPSHGLRLEEGPVAHIVILPIYQEDVTVLHETLESWPGGDHDLDIETRLPSHTTLCNTVFDVFLKISRSGVFPLLHHLSVWRPPLVVYPGNVATVHGHEPR